MVRYSVVFLHWINLLTYCDLSIGLVLRWHLNITSNWCFVLYTKLAFGKPGHYIKEQYGASWSGIQIVWLSGNQMAFKYWTIWGPTFFQPFKNRTNLVFRSPLCYVFSSIFLTNLKYSFNWKFDFESSKRWQLLLHFSSNITWPSLFQWLLFKSRLN